ncbi:MAG: TetR-like C-terminal domain-containing protein [Rhodococcus sp. (in: high G+C Gram-positive bacteria)]
MPTARENARTETTADIVSAGRRHLADVGPAALSLRAVAREIGVVSSAVYRYVASRDDLLTLLIVQCYDELGAALENADPQTSPRERWMEVCREIRRWAERHPHEYALLYGSPVPGYVAPTLTIEPATRPTLVLIRIVAEGNKDRAAGSSPESTYTPARTAITELYREKFGEDIGGAIDDDLVRRTLTAWTTVFGVVSFERFGHLVGSVDDVEAFYDDVVSGLADTLELQ